MNTHSHTRTSTAAALAVVATATALTVVWTGASATAHRPADGSTRITSGWVDPVDAITLRKEQMSLARVHGFGR